MVRLNWKRTIRLNILVLRAVGLWPSGDKSYELKNYYTLYKLFLFVCFESVFLASQTIYIFLNWNDIQAVTANIFVSLMEMLGLFKAFQLIKNMKLLKLLMVAINSDQFQPKNCHQLKIIKMNLKSWTIIASILWIFCLIWLTVCNLAPLIDGGYTEYRLPYLAWSPLNVTNAFQYWFIYTHQVISMTLFSMMTLNTDTLIAALNMYIGAQVDLLCDDLKNIYIVKDTSASDVEENIRNCIKLHREILTFALHANQFYNWLIFFQFGVAGICIGFSMFQLTVVVPFSGEFCGFFIYSTLISVQIFMYCWFGNEIQLKSSNLPYAIFESEWTSLSQDMKKDLIILLLRLQKPMRMSAFGLFNLSVDTFVRILRTAWSYFALLRQVNSSK